MELKTEYFEYVDIGWEVHEGRERVQASFLFACPVPPISEHIKHIFQDGELEPEATVRKSRTVQKEGDRHKSIPLIPLLIEQIWTVKARRHRPFSGGTGFKCETFQACGRLNQPCGTLFQSCCVNAFRASLFTLKSHPPV